MSYQPIISLSGNTSNFPDDVCITESANNAAASSLIVRKSRGTTTTPLSVCANDFIGAFQACAYNGSSYCSVGNIRYCARSVIGGGNIGAEIQLSNSDSNGVNNTNARIASNGSFLVGTGNSMTSTNPSVILGGTNNCLNSSDCSQILGGTNNCVVGGSVTSIIGGVGNCICSTTSIGSSLIVGGDCNRMIQSGRGSAILGGTNNVVNSSNICCGSPNSTIIGGLSNCIISGLRSTIVGGCQNTSTFDNNIILGGQVNTITNGCNSVIIGGTNNEVNVAAGFGISLGDSNTVTAECGIALGTGLTVAKTNTSYVNNLAVQGTLNMYVDTSGNSCLYRDGICVNETGCIVLRSSGAGISLPLSAVASMSFDIIALEPDDSISRWNFKAIAHNNDIGVVTSVGCIRSETDTGITGTSWGSRVSAFDTWGDSSAERRYLVLNTVSNGSNSCVEVGIGEQSLQTLSAFTWNGIVDVALLGNPFIPFTVSGC